MKYLATILAFMACLNAAAQDVMLMFSDQTTPSYSSNHTSLGNDTEIENELRMKNVSSGDRTVYLKVEIERLTTGAVQLCFPTKCYLKSTLGTIVSESTTMAAGEEKSVDLKWITNEDGNAKYRVTIFSKEEGSTTVDSTEHVDFIMSKIFPTALPNEIEADERPTETVFYDLTGRKQPYTSAKLLPRGIWIARETYKNGKQSSRKIVIL